MVGRGKGEDKGGDTWVLQRGLFTWGCGMLRYGARDREVLICVRRRAWLAELSLAQAQRMRRAWRGSGKL